MTSDKGTKSARVIAEYELGDKLSTDVTLDHVSQRRIGDQLRAMYDDLVQQPVPDRLRDLVEKLEQKGRETGR